MRTSVVFLATTLATSVAFAQTTAGDVGPAPVNPLDNSRTTVGTTTTTTTNTTTATPTVTVAPTTTIAAPRLTVPRVATTTTTGGSGVRIDINSLPTAEQAGVLPDVIRAQNGGLTAEAAAQSALRTSVAVTAAQYSVLAAQAQQAEAGRNMIPNLSFTFRYTRLSDFTPGSVPFPNIARFIDDPTCRSAAPPSTCFTSTQFSPAILDQFLFRTTLTIPLTDIPLRLYRAYEAAGLTAEARALDVEVARGQAGLAAREAFYEYMRALGQAAATDVSVAALERRREDLARTVEAGTAPRALLVQLDATLADIKRVSVLAHNGAELAGMQLRQRMHLEANMPLTMGESLDTTPAVPDDINALIERAMAERAEIRSLDRQVRALNANALATQAGAFPSVVAVANLDVANPNQRIFPQQPVFTPTWDATIQVTWSPNSLLTMDSQMQRLRAQKMQILAQRDQMREGFEMEVRAMWNAAHAAQAQLAAAQAAIASAEENYRVKRERVAAGTAVMTELSDAENDLLRARLQVVNAQIDLRVALARLRKAAGEHEVEGH